MKYQHNVLNCSTGEVIAKPGDTVTLFRLFRYCVPQYDIWLFRHNLRKRHIDLNTFITSPEDISDEDMPF